MSSERGGRLVAGRRGVLVMATAMALVVVCASASSAVAAPKGIFSVFSDCPVATPGVEICVYTQVTGGELVVGSARVPIDKPLILQGGGIPTGNPENGKEYYLAPARDGNSLSATELNVPGGLLGHASCEAIRGDGIVKLLEQRICKAVFEHGVGSVTATTEAVANEHNPPILNLRAFTRQEGSAITLPVRVHLKNALLGDSCYIGSEASPIQLHLTTGTTSPPPPNTAISGKRGNVETPEENGFSLLRVSESSLVDNTFSVPSAEGCGGPLAFLIDPLVDSKLGLPSAAGHNTAILNAEMKAIGVEELNATEKA
jgi:hypothetical protein